MTAERYLRQYERAVNRIRRLEREYAEEWLQIDAVRSPSDNDGMPHGSGISNPTADKAVEITDAATRLFDAKLEAIRIRQRVFDTVMKVDGLEADVLLERYIYLTDEDRLKPWEQVCDAVHYSWPTVRLAWHRGLDKVAELIQEPTTY